MAAAATFTRRPVAASTTTHAESPSKAPSSEASARGAAIYSQSWLLNIYDCNVRKGQHLDIGVGTDYYLAKTDLTGVQVTLADLNQDALDATKDRLVAEGHAKAEDIRWYLARHHPAAPLLVPQVRLHVALLSPALHARSRPSQGFSHLKHNLSPDGVISGASILGRDVQHNLFGRIIMAFGNWNCMFDKRGNNAADFDDALREHFHEGETQVIGAIFVWRASKSKI